MYAATLVEAVTYLSSARTALPLAASGIGHMHLLKRRLTMIMRGTTPRTLSAAGSLAVLGLAAVLLPLYPSWAQTGQRPNGSEEQQAPGATATTTGRAVDGADTSSRLVEQDKQPATGGRGRGFGAGAGAGQRSQLSTFGRGGGEGREYS